MFALHNKNKHAKSGDIVDFNFSLFKALQVPKGWDKLLISIFSVDTGKTVAKSGKALVHNGSCQWTDILSESTWVNSQDDSSNELEECFLKLVVSMGSARSDILGEAIVNMTSYMGSTAPVPVSLPLKKCNYGTILQVKIHCLIPRIKLRDEESKEMNFRMEDQEANCHDADSKSDGSGSPFTRSLGSSSSKYLGSNLHPGEPRSRETSFSESGSYHSYDSREGSTSIRREKCSPRSNLSSDEHSLIGRQEAMPQNSGYLCSNPAGGPYQSDHSPFGSQLKGLGNHSQNSRQEFVMSSLNPSGSSKSLMEAAQDTIEELHAEAKMWERNARKLMLDLDILRKEFTDQSKNHKNLSMELSAAYAERDGLKKAVEQLKLSLERPMVQQTETEHSKLQDEGISHVQKELKDELKFQKESNANLAMQLQRSQASNLELVSVFQELEETIENQKIEIENLSAPQSKFDDIENLIQVNTEENRKLMLQLQHLQESEKNLQVMVQLLERGSEDKTRPTNEGSLNKQTYLAIETEYKDKLYAKEEEIVSLRAKLCESLNGRYFPEMGSLNEVDVNLIGQMEVLKEKVQELERECNELTDENLELLFKLKEATKNSMVGDTSFDLPTHELLNKSFTRFKSEATGHKYITQTHCPEDKLKNKDLREIEYNNVLPTQELESLNMELQLRVIEQGKKLTEKVSEIAKLESKLLSKEEEIGVLGRGRNELEAKISNFQNEKNQLEEQMEVVQRESDITSKCLNDLRNDLMALSSSLDSHVSANKILERKSSELQNEKYELELCILELKRENVQLSALISGLEDQLRYLTDEKDSNQLELKNSKSYVQRLQDEISELKIERDSEKADMKEKLQDMQNSWSKAHEEREYLRSANPKLKATAESLVEECSTLKKSNRELRKQETVLHEQCSFLEAKLKESERNFADCSQRVGILEENLSSMLVDISSKEKSLISELDALLDDSKLNKEKFIIGEGLSNQMYLEKNQVETLQQEVEHLTKKLHAIHEEKERIASDAMLEVSSLREDNANLESDLQEFQSKMTWIENELNITGIGSGSKLQILMDELSASKQNQEMLRANHEKVLKLLENYKADEEKFRTTVNGLELRLTVSEYAREQLLEESKDLKVQLQNMENPHDEVLAFKNEIHAAKFEKESLEASLQLISEECEDLKAEKNLPVENICTLQKAMSEIDGCKCNRVASAEKLLQMDCGRMAKEALCVHDAELNNELSQIRIANRQYQWKIQLLEEEKDQGIKKAQALEEELKLMKDGKLDQRQSSSNKIPSFSKIDSKVTPVHEDMNPIKHCDTKRRQSWKNGEVQELVKDQKKLYSNQYQRVDNSGNENLDGSPHAVGVDSASKLQLLENELTKAMEENKVYKAQIDRLLSEGPSRQAKVPRKSTDEDEIVTKESSGRTISSPEAELLDIRERYLHMSLKYAEVEAQREELVMKLKAAKNVNRWPSLNSLP
ncbi:LOW QUALITY PROTEIN: intracellular protein transport protein USO1-like [Juglans microcarpa x Juglans regia]|uniref:LOW QUALITY PROTEIN: intracellular protein transport protein USO1-like n=1 Tax=Juglans microcarpa x Juglans regia TaxID=2249226 RepID=UPI001B7F7800|nr:LOW QUALITY PROTEIN: intracellular protein transport protein USO1-like [Juglans microcarpa x Juglans regia]